MVAWQVLAGPLNYRFQLSFFVISVCTLGIPHGAFDYLVEQEVFRRRESLFRGVIFRVKYLGTIVVYGLFWYLLPQFSLIAFLLMSSWHFAETDLNEAKAGPVSILVRLIYGISILSWIIFAHLVESHTIIIKLIPAGSVILKIWTATFTHSTTILITSGIIIIVALTLNQLNDKISRRKLSIFQLLIILSCCYFLPLLPAFVLYFVGWHSIITLASIKDFINGNIVFEKRFTTFMLILKAMPASLISIGFLLLTGLLFRNYAPVFDPLPLLFVFLSLITLPHMQIMYQLNKFSNTVNQRQVGSLL